MDADSGRYSGFPPATRRTATIGGSPFVPSGSNSTCMSPFVACLVARRYGAQRTRSPVMACVTPIASSCTRGGSKAMRIVRSLVASNRVKSWGIRKLRILGQASPKASPIALRIEVFPTPLGPTMAVSESRGRSTSSSDRKLRHEMLLIMAPCIRARPKGWAVQGRTQPSRATLLLFGVGDCVKAPSFASYLIERPPPSMRTSSWPERR